MIPIKPINFDPKRQLDDIKDNTSQTHEYVSAVEQKFHQSLADVLPKVREVFDAALVQVCKSVKDPDFAKALAEADKQGQGFRDRFCTKFRNAVSGSIPYDFPVVVEEQGDGKNVSIAQSYFGAYVYKHARSGLMDAVEGLRDGDVSEKLAAFEQTASNSIQVQIALSFNHAQDIKLMSGLLYQKSPTSETFRKPDNDTEHGVIYTSMLHGLGLSDSFGSQREFTKENLDNVRRQVGESLREVHAARVAARYANGNEPSAPQPSRVSSTFMSLLGRNKDPQSGSTPPKPGA